MASRIFSDWQPEHSALWDRHPIKLQHTLHQSPLFSIDGLAALIDKYPRDLYMLVHMGEQGGQRFWREGDIAGMSGHDVIKAISQGRLWLNLRCVDEVDKRYADVQDQMFAEIGEHIHDQDGFPRRSSGILISSPAAQVYYHCDLPNQSLWQVIGHKKVFIYPRCEPFLRGEDLERIAVYEVEVDMPFAQWYDRYAIVHDLAPGEMLHWPLNSPHRVTNYDDLNVSITTEYWAKECQRKYRVNLANGALRYQFGRTPTARETQGPNYLAKSLMLRGLSRLKWLKKAKKLRKPIDFTLDRTRPGQIVDNQAGAA